MPVAYEEGQTEIKKPEPKARVLTDGWSSGGGARNLTSSRTEPWTGKAQEEGKEKNGPPKMPRPPRQSQSRAFGRGINRSV